LRLEPRRSCVYPVKRLRNLSGKHGSTVSQRDLSMHPMEEVGTKILLQRLNLVADRGLRNWQLVCGSFETRLPSGCLEGA
jgi:hypothetical protein